MRSESIVRTKRVCVSEECSSLSRRILQNIDPEQVSKKSFYVLKILQKWNWNTIEFILHSSEILDEMFQKNASKFAIFYV